MAVTIRNPYAAPGIFRKAQLHCHTTESDGRFRPRDLLRMYQDTGYSFVCITDHNRVTRCQELDSGEFVAVPGTEDTVTRVMPPLGPHMVRLFVDEPLRTGTAQERIARTLADGGVVSLCHPSWTGNLWTGAWPETSVRELQGFQLMEIRSPHSDSGQDIRLWDAALNARGLQSPVWGVAVDDCHRQHQFNKGWIVVKVPEVSVGALKRALLGGAFYSSTGPSVEFAVDGKAIAVHVSVPGRLRFLDGRGAPRLELDGSEARYAWQGDERYVRVTARTGRGEIWSQPFWLIGADTTG